MGQLHIAQFIGKAGVVDPQDIGRAIPVDAGTEGLEKADQFLDVSYVGNIVQSHRLVGEQGGAEDGQGCVFIARRDDHTRKGFAPVDNKTGHIEPSKLVADATHGTAVQALDNYILTVSISPDCILATLGYRNIYRWR